MNLRLFAASQPKRGNEPPSHAIAATGSIASKPRHPRTIIRRMKREQSSAVRWPARTSLGESQPVVRDDPSGGKVGGPRAGQLERASKRYGAGSVEHRSRPLIVDDDDLHYSGLGLIAGVVDDHKLKAMGTRG